ncbi:MAG: hypothetical protein U9N49_04165, partial [Campylobacterota bacterium]|nr:hypothetical protein [Campylobacterota bacterium]
ETVMKTIFSLVKIFLFIGILFFFSSCGGGGSTDSSVIKEEISTLSYSQGDIIDADSLRYFNASFAETTAAIVQAVLVVNSLQPTEGTTVSLDAFKDRYNQAKEALIILEESAELTDLILDMFPSEEAVQKYIYKNRSKIDPKEVEAILNSSKSRSVIKPLMTHYKVNAKKAFEILQNSQEGLFTEYMSEAQRNENIVNVLKVVRDSSALTVTVGASVITAGGLSAGLSVGNAAGLVIQGADAVVKLAKSSAELIIGQDGALDEAYDKSAFVKAVSYGNEIVSIVSIKNLYKSGGWDDAGAAISDMVYISGKARDLVQDKKISFGSTLVVSDLPDEGYPEIENLFKDPIPMAYGTPDGTPDGDLFGVFKETLDVLLDDMKVQATDDVLVIIENTTQNTTQNALAGTISGGWSGISKGGLLKASGSFVMHISSDGKISGSYSGDDSGNLSGTISSNGDMDVKSGGGAIESGNWSGTVRRNDDGSLSGSGSWSTQGYSGGWSGTGA